MGEGMRGGGEGSDNATCTSGGRSIGGASTVGGGFCVSNGLGSGGESCGRGDGCSSCAVGRGFCVGCMSVGGGCV